MDQGRWSKQFLSNLAFYREGLKPWQRGLEIGMAHGYFLSHGSRWEGAVENIYSI